MANVSYHISNLLEKMGSADKDFRFMATNDFMNELQKDNIKLDDDSERKVVRMVLKLLEDKNGEVQNVAVKCLGPLIKKVQDYQVETIVDILCTNMVSENEHLRDISSIGLKTVVSEVPSDNQNLVGNVCRRVTGRLIGIIEKDDVSVQLEALDILIDMLSRFGPLITGTFERPILNCLLPKLGASRQAVRKRTIVALGHFVSSCSTFVYSTIIDQLLQSLGSTPIQQIHKTYIQCLTTICRHGGHRFARHIEQIAPIIIRYCQEDDEELHEYCLQAFQVFVDRCAKEMTSYLLSISDLCLQSLKYDPNYDYGSEFEEALEEESECVSQENVMETDEDLDENDEDDDYSDDEDMSWKIRRASAKCLETIILNGNEVIVIHFYRNVAPTLIGRFKEREENVKSDIFRTFVALLRKTKTISVPMDMDEDNPRSLLEEQVPSIVKHVCKLMRDKSVKTRQDCFLLLKELVLALPGAVTDHMGALIFGIQYSLTDKNSNIKIDALNFLGCLFQSHSPEIFLPFLNILIPLIITAVNDSFYKVVSEALQTLQAIIKVIRPLDVPEIPPEFTSYINDLYQCVLGRLCVSDIDQEVKERAIVCMGQILYNAGDYLQNELGTCLPIFLDRLKNEITRLTAAKTLNKIASSPLNLNLNSILGDVVLILGYFLRKNQRPLKIESLSLLNTLIRNYSPNISVELLQQIIAEMSPLINESDLHITQLTLIALISICELKPQCLVDRTKEILSEVVTLVQSPMLQGTTLQTVLDFIQILVRSNLLGMSHHDLLYIFIQQASEISVRDAQKNIFVVRKQAIHSLAKCVAAVVVLDQNEALEAIKQFLTDLGESQNDAHQIFLLYIVGEIGRQVNVDSIPTLKEIILESFAVSSEEVKLAASYALGSVAIGNLNVYVPFILKQIDVNPKLQYLLLHSLKEVIISCSGTPGGVESLANFLMPIWIQLFKYCESTEEAPRNIVAECLGKLTLIHPEDLLSRLRLALASPSPLVRATVITTVKYTITEQPQSIDPMLRESMPEFLKTLEDPDLNVRRMALITFNSAARNKPVLIRDLLPSILPKLYQETKIKPDLIRELEMGPFKHTVDDGLDIRKAAFECMYTLLDTCLDKLNIFEFLNHVEDGLKDHYDIKMLTYLMVIRLTQLCPTVVLQRLEQLVTPIRATCTLKLKANSVKQEYEKHEELKRSAIRAVAALYSMPDAAKNPFLMEFVNHIKVTSDLKSLFETIQKDSGSTGVIVKCCELDGNQMDLN